MDAGLPQCWQLVSLNELRQSEFGNEIGYLC